MKSICRPFTLYSDFLPPSNGSRQWDYLSFGYYDGVDVGEELFGESEWDLQKMWEPISKKKDELHGSYTEKIIFGFRTECDGENWEKEFWEKKEEFPFMFLVLLQNQSKGEELIKLWESRKEIEKQLCGEEVQVVSYLTLDNSDLLLVLGCKEYSKGARIIDGFHTEGSILNQYGWKLGYSYSISSIRKKFLNDSRELEKMHETIESVYIHMIAKYPGSTEIIYNQMYQKIINFNRSVSNDIEKKGILGCNDDVIILKNIPWGLFLSFYQDGQGILNHSSKEYKQNIIGVTTIIGVHENERKYQNSTKEDVCDTFCAKLRQKCKELLKDKSDTNLIAVKDKLLLLLNSLEKYENSLFSDYTYLSALTPINMLIEMVEEVSTRNEGTRYDEFYQFVSCFNMYAQTTVRSDRQFTETPGFNVQMYDTPVKINALYNAVIFDLKRTLNRKLDSEVPEYEFLICPGMISNMCVREIYADSIANKRLFLVDIPEKQAYNPQLTLTMISHEVSHVVGRKMRLRKEERFECIANMLAIIFVEYLYQEVVGQRKNIGYTSKEIWVKYYYVTIGFLKEKIKLEFDKEKMQKRFSEESFSEKSIGIWKSLLENYLYHTRVLRVFLEEYMNEIILDETYFYNILRESELKDDIEVKMRQLVQYSKWNEKEFNISMIIDEIMYLFKECFADMGAILSLNLSLEEYLESLIYATISQSSKVSDLIEQNRDVVRVSVVCECMFKEDNILKAIWDSDILYKLSKGKGDVAKLAEAVVRCISNDIYDFEGKDKECKKEKVILYNKYSLKYLIDYLSKCREKFSEEDLNACSIIQAQTRLQNLSKIFNNKDIESVIFGIQKYVDDYREMLKQEIYKHTK